MNIPTKSSFSNNDSPILYPITIAVFFTIFGILLGNWLFGGEQPASQLNGNSLSYFTNLFTEGVSILVTVFIIEQFNQAREKAQFKKREVERNTLERKQLQITTVGRLKSALYRKQKQALLDELAESNLLTQANLKLTELDEVFLTFANLDEAQLGHSSLIDASFVSCSMKSVDFNSANLIGTRFHNCNLTGSDFYNADLEGTNFEKSNLSLVKMWSGNASEANFREATLHHAGLGLCNLQNADFLDADLTQADLSGADLTGANLIGANLTNVIWQGTVYFDNVETAVLPDGSTWTPETNLQKFTQLPKKE